MKTKTKPNNSYINACILKDFKNFAKGGFNMLDEKCNVNPEFYDRIEADDCGNIIKVDGQPVTLTGTVFFYRD